MWTSSRKLDSAKSPGHTALPSSLLDHAYAGRLAIARSTSTSAGVSGSAAPSRRAIRRLRSMTRPSRGAAGAGAAGSGTWSGNGMP